MIYFASIDGGPIKIGYSFNVEARMEQLTAHYGRPVAILATMPGGRAEETTIYLSTMVDISREGDPDVKEGTLDEGGVSR